MTFKITKLTVRK